MTNRTVPVKKYHTTLLDTIRDINLQNKWFAAPINLGGVTGEGGGSGIPIGGLIGQLIQSKVAYDTTEASTLFTPVSGASLVDNLNHIRYWIDAVSGGGSSTFLDLTDVDEASYTGFEGYSVVVNTGEDGLEFVNVSGGAGSTTFLDLTDTPSDYSGYAGYSAVVNVGEDGLDFINVSGGAADTKKVMVSSDDTTEGYLEDKLYGGNFVTITTVSPGGNEQSSIAVAMSLEDMENVTVTDGQAGQALVYEGFGEWINATISGVSGSGIAGIDIEEAGTPKVTDATILNFVSGATVVDAGGGQADITVSGGGGGSAIDASDEGINIASGITSLDFVGNQLTATADGTDVTVTFSGIVVEPPDFIGVKTYLDSDWQMSTSDGWQPVSWDQEEYDTDGIWTSGVNQTVQTAGYYSIIGQVTLSGALPQSGRFEFGVFKNSTIKGKAWDGYYVTASGNRTIRSGAEAYFDVNDVIKMEVICEGSEQPYLISGVENSFLASHLIRGIFIEGATPEVCRVVWQNYLGVNDITDTEIPWDNLDDYDTGDFWDTGDDTKFSISTTGYYALKATALWETVYYQGVTPFPVRIAFRKNGSTYLGTHWDWNDVDTGGARSQGLSTYVSTDTYLESGDYVEVVVWHNKGSTANGIIRANDTYATIQRLG